jgi:hypothetical protein
MRNVRRGSTTFSVARWYGGGWDFELPPVPSEELWRSPPDIESELRERLYGVPGRHAAVDRLDRVARHA